MKHHPATLTDSYSKHDGGEQQLIKTTKGCMRLVTHWKLEMLWSSLHEFFNDCGSV